VEIDEAQVRGFLNSLVAKPSDGDRWDPITVFGIGRANKPDAQCGQAKKGNGSGDGGGLKRGNQRTGSTAGEGADYSGNTDRKTSRRRKASKRLKSFFREAGFKLGPYVGISFSISGPTQLFERFFRTRLAALKSYELPLNSLPKEVASMIEAVTFTPPPDFGPSGSGP
jgi:hypothetical protein